MYNENQKREYLECLKMQNRHVINWMITVFNKLEKRERQLGKDLSNWPVKEIIYYYKLISTSSLNTLLLRNSHLRAYARWCNDNHLIEDGQNHFEEIDVETLQSCVNVGLQDNSILTLAQLDDIVDDLLNPRDKCLVYALFEGIKGKLLCELVDLNVNQIKGNTLVLESRTVKVSEKLIKLMRESTEEYTYYAYGTEQKKLSFSETDTNVFKDLPSSRRNVPIRKRQRLYTNLIRIREYIGNPAINSTSLLESGRINMIKDLMSREENHSAIDVVKKYKNGIVNKYGKLYNYKQYLLTYGKYIERG